MDLSRLKWVKLITPPKGYQSYWAYTPEEIAAMRDPVINYDGLTIFPLGFKEKPNAPFSGDLMMLTQHSKITHIVEVLDKEPYEKDGWYHRYVKIIWWKPDMDDWQGLPPRIQVLGFELQIREGIPYNWTSLKKFREKWEDHLDGFKKHVAEQLIEL